MHTRTHHSACMAPILNWRAQTICAFCGFAHCQDCAKDRVRATKASRLSCNPRKRTQVLRNVTTVSVPSICRNLFLRSRMTWCRSLCAADAYAQCTKKRAHWRCELLCLFVFPLVCVSVCLIACPLLMNVHVHTLSV